ncbi:hypothetical protein [uncultured Roseibium sp.]|uniref:hypothetical protein n=1 Tax=uncultured Roseibium sp. TaxID=1936171 RepID=UPI00260E9C5F|nr:hypothetical protein [uncultured Roseibium sp.]
MDDKEKAELVKACYGGFLIVASVIGCLPIWILVPDPYFTYFSLLFVFSAWSFAYMKFFYDVRD